MFDDNANLQDQQINETRLHSFLTALSDAFVRKSSPY